MLPRLDFVDIANRYTKLRAGQVKKHIDMKMKKI